MRQLIDRVMLPELAAVHAAWLRFCAADAPRTADAVLAHFAPFHDNLIVVEIDHRHYTYRHYGQTFVESFNVDLAGQIIEYVPCEILPLHQRNMLEFEYNFVQHVHRPVWRSYTAAFFGTVRTWQRLVLPAGGDLIVVGAYEVPPRIAAAHPADPGERLLRQVIGAVPVYLDEGGDLGGLALSLVEFAETKSRERELEGLAATDPLTGVSNLRHFRHLAEIEIARAEALERPLAVLMLDIDYFKAINDVYGHAAGDEALRRFSATCREHLRKTDILGRYGGEEFAVLLPVTDRAEARQIAERLRRHVAAIRVPAGEETVQFTVSIGIAVRVDGDSLDDLLRRADLALYQAKSDGRDQVAFAHPAGWRRD